MGIGRSVAAPLGVIIVMVLSLSSPGAGGAGSASAAGDLQDGQHQIERPPCCFHACFDQCVPRDEFWFCQFSCYHRCAGGGRAAVVRAPAAGGGDCERSCARSMCGQLRPGSKMMAACRDTCRKSYAVAACTSSAAASASHA